MIVCLGARANAPYRYRLADPALRFHYAIVARHRGALETTEPEIVWSRIAQDLDSYIGHIFERIVEQAYYRLREARGLPIVEEWGRWEGLDRNRLPLEMDICARLDGPKILTGAIKWSAKPISAAVHLAHMRDLQRLADSGVAWAHGASSDAAVLLYVSAAGFEPNFADVATAGPQRVELWTLEDLFGDDAAGPRNFG